MYEFRDGRKMISSRHKKKTTERANPARTNRQLSQSTTRQLTKQLELSQFLSLPLSISEYYHRASVKVKFENLSV